MNYLTLSALPAGMLFALVTSITPGPNNTMLLASGVNFGFRRTLPHMFGISAGVAILMLSVGFGLGEAFKRIPILYTLLETASVVYLLYLAWRIGTSDEVRAHNGKSRPMTFVEAIAFQWVNPKAWMMVLTAATTIQLSADYGRNAVWMALVFVFVGLPCIQRMGGVRSGAARLPLQSAVAACLQSHDGHTARSIALSDVREGQRPLKCPSPL